MQIFVWPRETEYYAKKNFSHRRYLFSWKRKDCHRYFESLKRLICFVLWFSSVLSSAQTQAHTCNYPERSRKWLPPIVNDGWGSSLCPSPSVLSSFDLATCALRILSILPIFSFSFLPFWCTCLDFHFHGLPALKFLGEEQGKCYKLLLADFEYPFPALWLSSLVRLVWIFPLLLCVSHNLASLSNTLRRRGKNKWERCDLSWQHNLAPGSLV